MSFTPTVRLAGQPAGILALDDTGNYDAGSNPGGWGTPNPAKTDVVRILVAQSRYSFPPGVGVPLSVTDQNAYLTGNGAMVQAATGQPYTDSVYDIRPRIGIAAPGQLSSTAGSSQFTFSNANLIFGPLNVIGFSIDSLSTSIIYLIDRTQALTSSGGYVQGALPAAVNLSITIYYEAQGYTLVYQNGLACLNRDITQFAGSGQCCQGADLDDLMCRYGQYWSMLQLFATQDYARADTLATWLQKKCYQPGKCKPVGTVTTTTPTTPPAAPTITQQPVNQSISIGGSVVFSVTATGTDPLSYQWRKNGIDIPGATASILSLLNLGAADGATYSVIVYNAYGYAVSQSATLTLSAPLTPVAITVQPQPVAAPAGSGGTFSVTATGSSPISYQWRKNGVNITGANSSSYSITNAQQSDVANYDCVVSNAISSVTSNPAPFQLTALFRWGWRNTAPTVLSDVTGLQQSSMYPSGNDPIIADFSGGASSPQILCMAEDVSQPAKHSWFVDVTNQGAIGDPNNDLFVVTTIGSWRVYYTVYQTVQSNLVQFRTATYP